MNLSGLSSRLFPINPIQTRSNIHLKDLQVMGCCCGASLYADNCSFYGPISTLGLVFLKGCPDIQGIASQGDVVLQESTMRGNLWVSKNITIEKSVARGYIKFEGERLMANDSAIDEIIADGGNSQTVRLQSSTVSCVRFMSTNGKLILTGGATITGAIEGNPSIHISAISL